MSDLTLFASRPSTVQRDELAAFLVKKYQSEISIVSVPLQGGMRAIYVERLLFERILHQLANHLLDPQAWKAHTMNYVHLVGAFQEISARIQNEPQADNATLAIHLRTWTKGFLDIGDYILAPFAVERIIDPLCRKTLEAYGLDDVESVMAIVGSPTRRNAYQEYRLALITAFQEGRSDELTFAKIADTYAWYSEYSYVEPLMTADDVRRDFDSLTRESVEKELMGFTTDLGSHAQAYSQLITSVKDDELRHLLDIVHTYVWLRTDRVDQLKQAQMHLRRLYRTIAERLSKQTGEGWTVPHVVGLTYEEMYEYLEQGKRPSFLRADFCKDQRYVYLSQQEETKVILDKDEIQHVCEAVMGVTGSTSIKGMTAHVGSVKGTARIVWSKSDLPKIRVGDILVAKTTMPDYTQAMRLAAAFVTDEGGITSHAAIVSRELGRPCIVGTKNATSILKDGDEIEVDATKGIVKILKRAS